MTTKNLIGSGFFTMDDANAVLPMTIDFAKTYAIGKIHAKPNAHLKNINTAIAMVMKARTTTQLAAAISNYVLSHDYNEKVIK